jgi:hypothetical protein
VSQPPGGPPPPNQPPYPPPYLPPYPGPHNAPSQGPYPPPYWPPQGQPWQQPPPYPRPPKSNHNVLIGVIAAVVIIGAFLAVIVIGSGWPGDSASPEQRKANARTAQTAADFGVVCGSGSVRNAADYRQPYVAAAFHEGDRPHSWEQVSLPGGDLKPAGSINVVACLSRKSGTEVKSKTCTFQSAGKDVEADFYAVEYDLQLHQAKTGELIRSLGTVNGPANRCPLMAWFSEMSPKVYADPDPVAVAAKLAAFTG